MPYLICGERIMPVSLGRFGHRDWYAAVDSGYGAAMKAEELTPEAVALLRSLVNNSHAVEESPLLQLLSADGLVMGSSTKTHITAAGKRLLAQYEAARPF
jgi:hypothetical protein